MSKEYKNKDWKWTLINKKEKEGANFEFRLVKIETNTKNVPYIATKLKFFHKAFNKNDNETKYDLFFSKEKEASKIKMFEVRGEK